MRVVLPKILRYFANADRTSAGFVFLKRRVVAAAFLGAAVCCHIPLSAAASWTPSLRGDDAAPRPAQVLSSIISQASSTPASVPAVTSASSTAEKLITVSLKTQTLTYTEGTKIVGQFKISSGIKGKETPPGEYAVLAKKPLVDYKGPNYDYPNTKWNLLFKRGNPLNYYIHGAYWHHNFGHPMSHGCINVAYKDMEGLYNWVDVGTKIVIEKK